MFKESLKYGLLFFVVLTIWQWLFNSEIRWLENIGICFFAFLFYLLFEWSKKPYKYNKGNGVYVFKEEK